MTKSFGNEVLDRGMVQKPFQPWDETVWVWMGQGLDGRLLVDGALPDIPSVSLFQDKDRRIAPKELCYHTREARLVYDHEQLLGIDPVRRMAFRKPFIFFE